MMMKSYYIAKILYKLRISSFKNCKIDKTSKVDAQCVLAYVNVGRYSYVGSESHITSTNIGNFTSIGGGCQIGGGNHPLHMVSTSPVFLNGRNILRKNFSHFQYDESKFVNIGNDVWIGDGCYIKAGVIIGDGAIIGAHAVVTHDVEPYSIVGGCPAREIRKRFTSEIIKNLQRLEWWNWNDEQLQQYSDSFDDPTHLINTYDGDKFNEDSIRR